MAGDPLTREIHRLVRGRCHRGRGREWVIFWVGSIACATCIARGMPPIGGIDLERAAGGGGMSVEGGVSTGGRLPEAEGAPRLERSVGGLEGGGLEDGPTVEPAGDEGWLLAGWGKRVELGFNGVQGNAEGGSLRANVQASRSDARAQASMSATYEYATSRGDVTQNRVVASGRAERLMVDSPWRSFVVGSYESDQFRDWDHRVSVGAGLGYQFAGDGRTSLIARGGMSVARDVGGLDDRVRAEAILGLDFSHAISERQRVGGAVDYLPDVGDAGAFRANSRASWEIMIDPEAHLSLRIGGENRYDATARGGSRRDDLSYFAVLAVEF